MNENFLSAPLAKRLYEHVASLPILDYHNHLCVADLFHDRTYATITEMWIATDPYKHRAMRILGVPEDGSFDYTFAAHWKSLCARYESAGFTPLVLEPLPNALHNHIKTGDALRDQSIDTFLKMLPLMQECGITTVCFNFMAYLGWYRTGEKLRKNSFGSITLILSAPSSPTRSVTASGLRFIRTIRPCGKWESFPALWCPIRISATLYGTSYKVIASA